MHPAVNLLIKTSPWGKVDEVRGEHVETIFFGKFPIAPMESVLVREEDDDIILPVYGRSVLYGYLRGWLGVGMVVGATLIMMGLSTKKSMFAVAGFPLLAIAGALWYLAVFKWGRLAPEEEQRRILFHDVTGLSVTPEMLPHKIAKRVFRELGRSWDEHHAEWGGRASWEKTIQQGSTPSNMAFLAVMASYQRCLKDDRDSKALEAEAWKQLDHESAPRPVAAIDSIDPDAVSEETAAVPEAVAQAEQDSASRRKRARQADAKQKSDAKQQSDAKRQKHEKKSDAKGDERSDGAKQAKGNKAKRIRMECPRCEEVSRIPWDYRGKTGLCPRCKGAIRVPSMRNKSAA